MVAQIDELPEPDPEKQVEDEFKKAGKVLKQLEDNMEQFKRAAAGISKLMHIRYLALIEAGFSKSQAFDIVLKRGIE